ncbi:RSP_2648 family PIN domain-containing protein [Paracoccus cavernae]|uniref:RSP_2648 family PIN domain-containing protein n=1 Tax=Paracoccus cavernae TaxID=1571207 RepID=UPI00364382FA
MRTLLDACVLFPTILREILTDVAAAGAYTPLWSERILQEWRHATAKLGRDQQEIAGAEAALLQSRFPNAMVAVGRESELGVQLPDAGDLHVLKAALDGRADVIVTLNLRDFPARTLRQLGLSALHPDEFLTDLAARSRSCRERGAQGWRVPMRRAVRGSASATCWRGRVYRV